MKKWFSIVLILIALMEAGCSSSGVVSSSKSTPVATPLTSTISTNDWIEYVSTQHGVAFKYPPEWNLRDGTLDVCIAKGSITPGNGCPFFNKIGFSISVIAPYIATSTGSRLNIPQPTDEFTEYLADIAVFNRDTQPLMLKTDLRVNEKEAGAFLFDDSKTSSNTYTIVLRLNKYEVAILEGNGPNRLSQEMQDMLVALAGTVEEVPTSSR